jgi:hypothetical protein
MAVLYASDYGDKNGSVASAWEITKWAGNTRCLGLGKGRLYEVVVRESSYDLSICLSVLFLFLCSGDEHLWVGEVCGGDFALAAIAVT